MGNERSGSVDILAAVLAGGAGAAAYLAAMDADLRLVGYNADDLVFLGRPFAGGRREWARPAGLAVHLVNGVGLGLIYALVAERRLSGPAWWRGVAYANIENGLLYPLCAFVDRVHPAVRDGQLDRYWAWPAFGLSVLRHIAYGAALGVAYDRLRRRSQEA